jgi:hypothetical protein
VRRCFGVRHLSDSANECPLFSVIPSEDAHGSEYVATCDRRREWISGYDAILF